MSGSSKERVAELRKRVEKDPYDAAAWEELVSEADRTRRGPERDQAMAAVYEDLLNKFPTAVRAAAATASSHCHTAPNGPDGRVCCSPRLLLTYM